MEITRILLTLYTSNKCHCSLNIAPPTFSNLSPTHLCHKPLHTSPSLGCENVTSCFVQSNFISPLHLFPSNRPPPHYTPNYDFWQRLFLSKDTSIICPCLESTPFPSGQSFKVWIIPKAWIIKAKSKVSGRDVGYCNSWIIYILKTTHSFPVSYILDLSEIAHPSPKHKHIHSYTSYPCHF